MKETWISLTEAASLTQRPERTLRHQLAKGRITGKKSGHGWLVDLESLRRADLVKALPPLPPAVPQPSPALSVSSIVMASVKGTPNDDPSAPRVRPNPKSLIPYTCLMDWKKRAEKHPTARDVLLPMARDIQRQMAAGYFEFSRNRKIELYRRARDSIAFLWVELDNLAEQNEELIPLQKELEDVLSGLAGVLRKIDKLGSESKTVAET